MKVLLVTMFFPPTGGGAVQRPLKFAQYLPELGIDTYVVAPDDSKWIERDESLLRPSNARVISVRNLSPATRLLGMELYGRRGLRRLLVQGRFVFRRALIPDASIGWLPTALPSIVRLIRQEKIDVLLTTSPPLSVNLIGAAAKRLTGVRWVADIRDSIVFHSHRRREIRGEGVVARLVARRADVVVTATPGIAEEFRRVGRRDRLDVIESGCDFDDFAGLSYRRCDRFRITHTGNFHGARDPRPFLDALASSSADVVARFVGDFRPRDRDYADQLGLGPRLELIPFVPRRQALELQRDSDALLLLVPEADGRGLSVLTGKVFEYLAAGRPILAAVPERGDAAALIRRSKAGFVIAPTDVVGLAAGIRRLHEQWRTDGLDDVVLAPEVRETLSRRAQVERLAAALEQVG